MLKEVEGNMITRKPKKVRWEEIEDLINLARNTLKMSEGEVQAAIGISEGNFSTWRKVGFAPAWSPHALRGLISLNQPKEVGQLQIGMRFTNDQLEYLNLATGEYASRHPDVPAMKNVRSVILLELAARLAD